MALKSTMAAAVLSLFCAQAVVAEAQAQTSVEIGNPGPGIHGIPVLLAIDELKKRGVKATLEDFNGGGTQIIQSLVGGSLDFGVAFYDHAVSMQPRGKDIVCVALLTRFPAAALMLRSDLDSTVHSLADLKGHVVGVPGLNSSGDLMLKYWLARANVPASAVPVAPVGGSGTAIAALRSKSIDAVFVNDPGATVLLEQHIASMLVDGRSEAGSLQAFGGSYPSNCLFVTKGFADKNPAAVQQVVDGFVAALQLIQHSTPAEIVARMPASWIVGEPSHFAEILKANMQVYSPGGRIEASDVTGFPNTKALLSLGDDVVKQASIDYDRTYTNKFVDQAVKDLAAK